MSNFQPPNFKAMARDIFKTISPKIAQKVTAFFL